MLASLVGFYNLPFFRKILPKYKLTSMRTIILNCTIFLVFSSALPVSSKILGLTSFDLLGHFGDLHWLANVNLILAYNFSFATATGLCLITKFTATVREELYKRVVILFQNYIMNILSTTPKAASILIGTASTISSSSKTLNNLANKYQD